MITNFVCVCAKETQYTVQWYLTSKQAWYCFMNMRKSSSLFVSEKQTESNQTIYTIINCPFLCMLHTVKQTKAIQSMTGHRTPWLFMAHGLYWTNSSWSISLSSWKERNSPPQSPRCIPLHTFWIDQRGACLEHDGENPCCIIDSLHAVVPLKHTATTYNLASRAQTELETKTKTCVSVCVCVILLLFVSLLHTPWAVKLLKGRAL